MLKFLQIDYEVMCGFVHKVLVYYHGYFMWFNDCVHVFLPVSNLEFLAERWD
jgi:hypothetical protein